MTTETSNARGEVVAVPREVIDFLMGEGELQGAWFGETPTGERGQWFWRKHLRRALCAAPPPAAARGDVRGLVAKWRASVRSAKQYSTTVYEDGYAAAENACANELEAALAAEGVHCDSCNGSGVVVTYVDPYERGDVSSPEQSPCPDCAEGVQAGEVEQQPEARGAPLEPAGKPVGWWNGISNDWLGPEGSPPSIRWGADAEDSGHDIPLYSGYNPIHFAKAEARGVVDEGSRSVTSQLLHWGGIPVYVTGTVTTSPGNWPLIDAALTEARNVR